MAAGIKQEQAVSSRAEQRSAISKVRTTVTDDKYSHDGNNQQYNCFPYDRTFHNSLFFLFHLYIGCESL